MGESIKGRLELLEKKDPEVTYLVVKSPTKVVLTEGGQKVTSNSIQIAGLDQKEWDKALKLVGKEVVVEGNLMGAHTRYHFEPILIITSKVTPAKAK